MRLSLENTMLHFLAACSLLLLCLPFNTGGKLTVETWSPESFAKRSADFTSEVTFDNYSLILRGQRIFLYSGEFHTYRLPVPDLWPDIMQKIKAAGLNAISVYTHMGQLNPSNGVIDLDGYRSLQGIYEAAKAAGLWLVMRPGPYINAETSAGGMAHWTTTEVPGLLRSNDSSWTAAWQDYVHAFINETLPYQVTEGGPVIAIQVDNEYSQSVGGGYFALLEAAYRSSGIVVPLTYNDPGEGANFINGTGAVDLYGLDSYPQSFDCSHPLVWDPVVTNYHTYHESVDPGQPFYVPEFQGGAFDPWGPNAPGYPNCGILTGADFMSVFYKQLWASNVKLASFYMMYGGTSWGAIPFHGVYTSYDYGATISEDRTVGSKYDELKRQGFFLRSSPAFYKTDWISDSNSGLAITSNPAVFATFLRNPDTATGFYILRQTNSTSTTSVESNVTISTSIGSETVPVALNGRQSKVVVTDYAFGSSHVVFSTASIYFAGVIDGRDVIVLYGDSAQSHEFALRTTGTTLSSPTLPSFVSVTRSGNTTLVNIATGNSGVVTIRDSSTQLVLFGESVAVAAFWAPIIPGAASNPFSQYWSYGTNETILVSGPYLLRKASITGSTLALTGDLNSTTSINVVAPSSVSAITWNGARLQVKKSTLTAHGGLTASLPFSGKNFTAPALTGWKFKDSLPEISAGFDDSSWTVANHTTSNIPWPMYYGDGRITYGCDYGFCENIVLWRGHFTGTGAETSANLSINGGEAFAASVWLNDVFLNTSFGNSSDNVNTIEETDDVFKFPAGSVRTGDNVITIVQDNMGLNETNGLNTNSSKSPRGVRGYKLNTGNFTEWKVQGKIGGYKNYPDKTRGVMNEGGLFGERSGWHLPGFDTSSWENRDLSAGLPGSAAGVGFFVTTFNLDIPSGFDVPISFTFTEPLGQPYRVYLFVNGWMMGKRVGNLGPQAKFPVQQGILNYNGVNTVAVALWAMEANVTISPQLKLVVNSVFEGGVGKIATNNPPFSPEGRQA